MTDSRSFRNFIYIKFGFHFILSYFILTAFENDEQATTVEPPLSDTP